MQKRIKCKFCNRMFKETSAYASHLENSHADLLPEGLDGWRSTYFFRTGKTSGNCIICHKPTTWNDKTHKYHRFCDNPACKEKYKEEFNKRMMGKYGKIHLLNDPEQQKVMLSRRKISNTYTWSDHVHKFVYTGKYELDFLQFLDHIMNFDPEDIMAPSPHTYYYVYENKRHFYIPDFFIPSLDLEVEVKDGRATDPNANQHHKMLEVDRVKETLKDEVMKYNGAFNYLKIVGKDNMRFFQFLEKMQDKFESNDKNIVYMP